MLTPNPRVRRLDQQREQIRLIPLPAFVEMGRLRVRGNGDVELDDRRLGLRIPVARAREPSPNLERNWDRKEMRIMEVQSQGFALPSGPPDAADPPEIARPPEMADFEPPIPEIDRGLVVGHAHASPKWGQHGSFGV